MTTDVLDVAQAEAAEVQVTTQTTSKSVLVYMRTLLERGMAAFTTGGSDPLSVVDVTLGDHRSSGHAPVGWAYIYDGDPASTKLGDPSCHKVVKWHTQRFSGERGGINPSHLHEQRCRAHGCGFVRFITSDTWNEVYEENSKPQLAWCPRCKSSGMSSKLTVETDIPRFNHSDVALRKYIVSSMKKQDLNTAPLLPRVYGMYTGKDAQIVDDNFETSSWGPGDNDEGWMTRTLKQYERTAVVRPYSLSRSLLESHIKPDRWLMLVRETTCGWVMSDNIGPVDSTYQTVNGYIRGWAIDLVTPRER